MEIPHPAEVLAIKDYDPAKHLISEAYNSNIASIPDCPEYLLRWYPYDIPTVLQATSGVKPISFNRPRTLPRLTTDVLDHLQVLHDSQTVMLGVQGIDVAPHTMYVCDANPTVNDAPALFTIVKKLSGTRLRSEDTRGHDLAENLRKYAALTPSKGVFLSDILKPEQYTIDTEPDSRPILHDLDPIFRLGLEKNDIINSDCFRLWLGRRFGTEVQF